MERELEIRLERIEKYLASMKQILTLDELSEYIGLSKSRIYSLCSQREIPHYKQGKLYFKRAEIEDWLTSNKVCTQQELKQIAQTYCVTN